MCLWEEMYSAIVTREVVMSWAVTTAVQFCMNKFFLNGVGIHILKCSAMFMDTWRHTSWHFVKKSSNPHQLISQITFIHFLPFIAYRGCGGCWSLSPGERQATPPDEAPTHRRATKKIDKYTHSQFRFNLELLTFTSSGCMFLDCRRKPRYQRR